MYCIVLYCIVLYCIVLYCIVLYCIVLYCIVLYCIVLYCIVLYCIVLYIICNDLLTHARTCDVELAGIGTRRRHASSTANAYHCVGRGGRVSDRTRGSLGAVVRGAVRTETRTDNHQAAP